MTSSGKPVQRKSRVGSRGRAKAGSLVASSKMPSAVKRTISGAQEKARSNKSGQWALQDAKARFSELVRLVKLDGPQRVSVHGRVEVVVISADEFRRLNGKRTGAALVDAMQASPHRDVDIAPVRLAMPVRKIEL